MKESKHNLTRRRLKAKYAAIRNMKVQRGLLLQEPPDDYTAALRDLDKLESMFLIQPCDSRKTIKEGDKLVHKCTNLSNHDLGKVCRLRLCPL